MERRSKKRVLERWSTEDRGERETVRETKAGQNISSGPMALGNRRPEEKR